MVPVRLETRADKNQSWSERARMRKQSRCQAMCVCRLQTKWCHDHDMSLSFGGCHAINKGVALACMKEHTEVCCKVK